MTHIIKPRSHVDVTKFPVFFLAGPIRGADNWRYDAIDYLREDNPEITIASPAWTVREDQKQYLVEGKTDFHRQRAWERHYLDIAAKTGSVIFWLPPEFEHRCEKAYGAITRFELGQWLIHKKYDPSVHLTIGREDSFPEISTVIYDIQQELPNLEVHSTLETTCRAALDLAK